MNKDGQARVEVLSLSLTYFCSAQHVVHIYLGVHRYTQIDALRSDVQGRLFIFIAMMAQNVHMI